MWILRARFEVRPGELWIGAAWMRDRAMGEADLTLHPLPALAVHFAWRWVCPRCRAAIVRRRDRCGTCALEGA